MIADSIRRRSRWLIRHPLTWVLLLGVVVRIVLMAGVSVSLGYSDSTSYVAMANDSDAGVGVAPLGYPLFLRAIHEISSSVDAVLIVQHGLMIVAAIAVYRIARRLSCGRTTSTMAAAVMVLSGNLLSLGQAILTDGLVTVLVTVTVLQALRFFDRRSWVNALLLGLILGAAVVVKSVALPLAVLALLAVFVSQPNLLSVGKAAAVVGAVSVVVALVAVTMSSTSGLPIVGKSAEGWLMYGRVAQFADCAQIKPSKELRSLCPSGPPATRPGPDYWRVIGGPAVKQFGHMPNNDSTLMEFAVDAIEKQPIRYLRAVGVDTARFLAPNFGQPRAYTGAGWDEIDLNRVLDPTAAQYNKNALQTWFSSYHVRTSTLGLIGKYQALSSVRSGHLSVLLLLCLLAVGLARGKLRIGIWFVLLSGLAILVGSTALNMYVARYAAPAFGPLLAGAALGIELGAVRIARARIQPAPR